MNSCGGRQGQSSGCCLIFWKQLRDSTTLVPIIQECIAPGSEIWSDEWAAYRGISGILQLNENFQKFLTFLAIFQTRNWFKNVSK